jgi:hypothetical protein
LTGTGGNTYVWNNSINGSTITATQGGTYIVTAYAANGCSDAAEVTVTALVFLQYFLTLLRNSDFNLLSVTKMYILFLYGVTSFLTPGLS